MRPFGFTRRELDTAKCTIPGCDHADHTHLFIGGQCHPNAAVTAAYSHKHGCVSVWCAECGDHIIDIKVAAT